MEIHVKKTEDINGFNGIYKTIAQLTSVDDCLLLYQNFKGLTVSFPTKLLDSDYVKDYLRKELQQGKSFSKEEIQQLALSFDYSERQLRRFLSEAKEEVRKMAQEEEIFPRVAQWLQIQNDGGEKNGE